MAGKKLLDGGFRVNCPAEIGYEEGKCLWPEKPLDILVSLGTGVHSKRLGCPQKNLALRVGRQVVEAITNSTQLWRDFQARIGEDKSRCFRFDPSFSKDFRLADVKDLTNISSETESWLGSQGATLAHVSNQLIAALFFCTACATPSASAWTCYVSCRLSHTTEGKAALVDRLIEVAGHRDLFTAKSSNHAIFHCDAEKALMDWRHAGSQGLIVIPLTISDLPTWGDVKIHINMADIFRDDSTCRYPISGMPYLIRRNVK